MIEQAGIALFGTLAVWLSQDRRDSVRRYACIAGLLSQPFWYYSAIAAEQWGIVIVCVPYTIAWLRGYYYYWLKPN